MSHKTAATVAHTIGIDTGKNTLHLIGLEDKGAIVLREKIARGDHGPARQCAAVPDRNRSWHGDALTMNFAIEKCQAIRIGAAVLVTLNQNRIVFRNQKALTG